jgi:sugar phosphate isomerase/epimerase
MSAIYFSGFADEAGQELETQINATRELGWSAIEMRNVTVRGFEGGNLHDISGAAFDALVDQLAAAGVRVNSLGSAIANGAQSILNPFDVCEAASRRAAVRARRLSAEFVRIMSYPVGDPSDLHEEERFRRLREIVAIFSGSGVVVVHENCGNYGGMGWTFSLRLLENVPGLKLVFDMGNCFHDLDYTKKAPYPYQDAWEFYEKVRDHVVHLHVKDGLTAEDGKAVHTYPGQGTCDVKRIIDDLLARGYAGAFSIEPHIGVAPEYKDLPEAAGKYRTYVKCGQVLESLFSKT